jgi:hypothetical protein
MLMVESYVAYRMLYIGRRVPKRVESKRWSEGTHSYLWRDHSRRASQEAQGFRSCPEGFILLMHGQDIKHRFYLCKRKRNVSGALAQKQTAEFRKETRHR